MSFIFDGLPEVAQPPMQTYGGSWDMTLKYEYGDRLGTPCSTAASQGRRTLSGELCG